MNEYKSNFLDTNIFLRLLNSEDPRQHTDCEQLMDAIRSGRVAATTSSLILAEVAWVTISFYKMPKFEVVEFLRTIGAVQNLKFEEKTNSHAAVDCFQKFNIKFADCLIASHPDISSGKMTIISYDKDFDKLGVKRLEPTELLKQIKN